MKNTIAAYFYIQTYWLFFILLSNGLQAQTELLTRVNALQLSEELPARSQLGGLSVDRLGYIYVANFLRCRLENFTKR